MRLSDLSEVQATALGGLLRLWRDQADVTLDGAIEAFTGPNAATTWSRSPCRSRTQRHRSLRPARRRPGRATALETTVINATQWTGSSCVPLGRSPERSATATAAEATSITPTGAGLVELAVPPYGSLTIHTAETSRAGSPSSRHTAGPASGVQASGRTSPQAREPPQLGPTLPSSPSNFTWANRGIGPMRVRIARV